MQFSSIEFERITNVIALVFFFVVIYIVLQLRENSERRSMARTTFARTVVKTICDVKYIDRNNEEKSAEVVLFGDYDMETAQKPAVKKLNAKGGVVTAVRHESFYGKMNIEKFAEMCDKTNYEEW